VRDSYADWKQSYLTSTNARGFQRVIGSDKDRYPNETVSEGIAYGMILAAYLDDQQTFDDLWGYAQEYFNTNSLMSWRINAAGEKVDQNSATDADEDMAFALIVADKTWGGYETDATTLLANIMQHDVEPATYVLKPGDAWGGSGTTNPSYFAPAYYRIFAEYTGNDEWRNVADTTYDIIANINTATAASQTGLLPDWASADGTRADETSFSDQFNYTYDAARVPWRLAKDAIWYCTPEALNQLDKLNSFFKGIGAANIKDGYQLDGTVIGQWNNAPFVAPIGAAAVLADDTAYQQSLWQETTSGVLINENYYNESLRLLSLLVMTGMMDNPLDNTPTQPTATPTATATATATATPTAGTGEGPTRTPVPTPDIPNIILQIKSGWENNQLRWEPPQYPWIRNYMIYRFSPTSATRLSANELTNGDPLTELDETFYFDTSSDLQRNTEYCYRVEAINTDGNTVAESENVCATFGVTNLWIPETWGKAGSNIIVPVNVSNAEGLQIGSADIWIDFRNDILEPVDITNTTLTNRYAWSSAIHTTDDPDYSRVKISTIASPPPELYGEGSLFWITFKVIGNEGESSPLIIQEFVEGEGGSEMYAPDPNNPGELTAVKLSLQNNTFHVGNAHMLGDVDGNDVIGASDAYLALQIASGVKTATTEQQSAGDANGNALIDAADATMILYRAANDAWPSISETLNNLPYLTDTNPTLKIDGGEGKAGDTITAVLRGENLTNWAGSDLIIAYDQSIIAGIREIRTTDMIDQFQFSSNTTQAGIIRLSLAGSTAVNGNGALLEIDLQLADTATKGVSTPLSLLEARLHDAAGRDFATSALRQSIQRENGTILISEQSSTDEMDVYLPLIQR
jgi:endo-1,4-beta-D-glucanase Y